MPPELSDAVLQRRFRTTCVEQHEMLALTAVMNLISRNLSERAGR